MYRLTAAKLINGYTQILTKSSYCTLIINLACAWTLILTALEVFPPGNHDHWSPGRIQHLRYMGLLYLLAPYLLGSLYLLLRYIPRYRRSGLSYLQIQSISSYPMPEDLRTELLAQGNRQDFLELARDHQRQRAYSKYSRELSRITKAAIYANLCGTNLADELQQRQAAEHQLNTELWRINRFVLDDEPVQKNVRAARPPARPVHHPSPPPGHRRRSSAS